MPGPMEHSPAYIILQALVDAGYGSNPDDGIGDWPIYDNRESDEPDDVIRISDTQGIDHGYLQPDGERQEMEGIQVMVRSADKDDGWKKSRQIAMFLDGINFLRVTLDSIGTAGDKDYVIQCVERTSNIIPLGADVPAGKRSRFVINGLVTLRMCC